MDQPGLASLSRRRFLQTASAAALAAALPVSLTAAAGAEWRNRQGGMAYRRLGRTGFMISEVICGGNTISPTNHRHLELAIEMGLNYCDTAPAYGRGESEKGYGKVLEPSSMREKVFLNTKVSAFDLNRNARCREIYDRLTATQRDDVDREVRRRMEDGILLDEDYLVYYGNNQKQQYEMAFRSDAVEKRFPDRIDRRQTYTQTIIGSVEESLRRLKTDYLDLLMCPHGVTSPAELQIPEIFEAFHRLKQDGKVRFLGASAHNDPAALVENCARSGRYDVCMPAFNVVNGKHFTRAFAAAREADLGIIAMKAARAVYSGRPNRPSRHTDAIAYLHKVIPGDMKLPMKAYLWALQHDEIAAVNAEMITEEHVRDNLPLAGKKVALPDAH